MLINHWNLKMHKLTQHSTLEERTKSKYYCNICDLVFFSQLYHKLLILSTGLELI